MEPEKLFFFDDGSIPNSSLPVLIYRSTFSQRGEEGAKWLEDRFAANNWRNSWRNGIYDFHHYHSTSHEVLGVYSGTAKVYLGGEGGERVKINAGDILIIPVGVGHKNGGSADLGIVGAYPDGMSWDLNRGLPGERPTADENIASLKIPDTDPLHGAEAGVCVLWR